MLNDNALTENHESEKPDEALLDQVFFALSDSTRRSILQLLDQETMLVSEIAERFPISVQAISRHVRVLVDAGLVSQERTGRISRCSLNAGPIFSAAVWINRYSKYWQEQFDDLANWVKELGLRELEASSEASEMVKPSKKGKRK